MNSRTPSNAPHAPEVGWAGRLLGRFHVTGVFWFQIHRLGVRYVPRIFTPIFIPICTLIACVVLRRIRAALLSNLAVALGPCGFWERQRRVYRSLNTFAWCLTERYERISTNYPFHFSFVNQPEWDRITSSSGGFMMVTAHVGNWEVGAAVPSQQERRVHLVREPESDPRAQEFIRRILRERMGDTYVTHFADEDLRLGMALRDALAAGDLVALQIDRPRKGGRVTEVELFDRPFSLPIGPMVLARAAGIPILPVFVLRSGRRRYRLVFRPAIELEQSPDRDEDIRRAASKLADEVGWAIREEPHQWFCFRELWPQANSVRGGVRADQP